MRIIIDRIEADIVVVEKEDGSFIQMPKSLIPLDAKEGDMLLITIDEESTVDRKKEITSLMEELWDDEEDTDSM